jgi:Ser-tRNA(Ala) deacylase AlaX
MKTKLNYLEHPEAEIDKAVVLRINSEEIDGREHYKLVLDQTILYPQGGGQPSDLGYIKRSSAEFEIEKVYYDREEDEIIHYGYIKQGNIAEGDRVTVHLDYKNRIKNSKYHSAGHIIDIAVKESGLDWKPVKGYHFPKGAYIEYELNDPADSGVDSTEKKVNDRQELKKRLEEASNRLVNRSFPTEILTVESKEEMSKYCEEIPEYIPEGKPVRIVRYGTYPYTACGGTHVKNSLEVGEIKIRKLKFKGNNVRISYKLV